MGRPAPMQKAKILEGKKTEWNTIKVEKRAVTVLTLAESKVVRDTMADRIVRSRFVLVEKDGGDTVKARLTVKGFDDPDLLAMVERGDTQAPTVSQNARAMALQLIASNQWKLQLGDVKGAFLESDKLDRPTGDLFMSQPPGGLPGEDPNALIRIDLPLYGLNDAPKRWYLKFVKVGLQVGLVQSRLDPASSMSEMRMAGSGSNLRNMG